MAVVPDLYTRSGEIEVEGPACQYPTVAVRMLLLQVMFWWARRSEFTTVPPFGPP